MGLVGAYPGAISAQGLTGASVQGRVINSSGSAVPAGQVTLTNRATGSVRRTTARNDGSFLFENLPVGGPYRIEARFLGYEPASLDGITLHVGDHVFRNLTLGDRAHSLNDVEVLGSGIRDAGAGGPAYSITGSSVRNLPLRDRNFVGLLAMGPLATGASALSVSGQHSRFNSIQVDGGSSNDFFGVNLTAGAAAGGKVISLEALEEIRVLVAPFDVRQGGFSGGLINAVTRSGTNQFQGSTFLFHSRPQLIGRDTAGARAPEFNLVQYGASVGGPIIRNRLHFLAAVEIQARSTAFIGPSVADPATGISSITASRAAQIFRDQYGFDPGGPEPPRLDQPNRNLFLKLSGQATESHWLEVTHNRAEASSYGFNRLIRNLEDRQGWQLSNSGFTTRSSSSTTRLRVTSDVGGLSNEVVASVAAIDDNRDSRVSAPLFLVRGDLANTYLAAGSEKSAQGTETDQRLIELIDNISWSRGAHVVTAGTQNQFLHFRDNLLLGSWGVFTFNSVDALERREPSRYEVAFGREGTPIGRNSPTLLAGYIQDRWAKSSSLTLTAGLRVDVPLLDAPERNPLLAGKANLGNIDTGVFPSANAVLSPRIGFAWQVGANRRSMVRGGIGGFAGRPVFAWLAAAFNGTGQEQSLLVCDRAGTVPAPTTDIERLPTSCLGATSALPSPQRATFYAPDFRFQQAIKYAVGADHDFGSGLTASLDLIHSRTRNHLYVSDINLVERGPSGEGRVMYGTIDASRGGVASRPTRVDSLDFGSIYRFGNATADRSTAIALEIQKRWNGGRQLQLGYSWSRTEDVMSLGGFHGLVILQVNPLDGTMAKRNLRRSARDIPHNLVATAVVPTRFGITGSIFLRARSGTPYAFIVNGDANGDGISNDLAYIPRDAADMSLANPAAYELLNTFIESDECLQKQRGAVMKRNSCRNPSVTMLDFRLAKTFRTRGDENFEVTADVFNLPNFFNRKWGRVRETSSREDKPFLSISGWDTTANRPRYLIPVSRGQLALSRNAIVVDPSRWSMQVGARYSFR